MALFKQPEHKRFNLKPRYWDPEAEARKEREKRIRAELGLDENGGEYIPDVRAGLRKEYNKKKVNHAGRKLNGYTFRLFLILIILLMVAFYLVSYKLDTIMKFF